jgi:hypothetical protein
MDLNTYKLPAALTVALSTNRPEILRAVTPASLMLEDVQELLRLLSDLISDRQKTGEKIEELRQVVAMHIQTGRGLADKLEMTWADLDLGEVTP